MLINVNNVHVRVQMGDSEWDLGSRKGFPKKRLKSSAVSHNESQFPKSIRKAKPSDASLAATQQVHRSWDRIKRFLSTDRNTKKNGLIISYHVLSTMKRLAVPVYDAQYLDQERHETVGARACLSQ